MFESAKTDLPLTGENIPGNVGVRYHIEDVNLDVPRDTYLTYDHGPLNVGGIAATTQAYLISGPVSGKEREYANINVDFPRNTSNPAGPVSGGADVNTGAYLAYQASLVAAITQAQSSAAVHP